MNWNNNNKKVEEKKKIIYPVIEMAKKGRLRMSPEIISQVQFLHASIGKTEWSGILLYDVISGSPKKPEDFVLEAKHIFLMDIGSAAYTEYSPDEDIIDLYDNVEGSMDMKTGHIHTHHDMSAFFSGTDTGELQDNVDKHNYYLSLIVNFSGDYVAKVAFLSDINSSQKMSFKDDSGKLQSFTQKTQQKAMVVIDMTIMWTELSEFFTNRIPELRKKEEERKKKEVKKDSWYGNAANKGYNDNYYGYQKQLGFKQDYSKKVNDIDRLPQPENLTDREVEKLARNIISVTTDLTEVRPIYTLLYTLSDDTTNGEMEFYYDHLSNNLSNILESFFGQPLEPDNIEVVLTDVIHSIERFSGNAYIKDACEEITKILEEYILFKYTDEEDDDKEDDYEKIQKELNRT